MEIGGNVFIKVVGGSGDQYYAASDIASFVIDPETLDGSFTILDTIILSDGSLYERRHQHGELLFIECP
jgi:hypothetical protein